MVAVGLDMQLPVKQIMTKTPAFLTKNKTLFDAVCLMNEISINHLPVLDEITNAPVGMITATDVFKQQRNNVLLVIFQQRIISTNSLVVLGNYHIISRPVLGVLIF